jgi:hypothetical protein
METHCSTVRLLKVIGIAFDAQHLALDRVAALESLQLVLIGLYTGLSVFLFRFGYRATLSIS